MWLPMLLLAVMASGSACPDFCQCSSTRIECRGQPPHLEQLEQLPHSVVELALLDIQETHTTHVQQENPNHSVWAEPESFIGRLQTLDVSNCSKALNVQSLCKLGRLCFPILSLYTLTPELRSLNLSHNNLWYFPDLKISKLRVVDVSYNRIRKVEFKKKTNITWLSLADNELSYLKPRTFENCSQLEELDLFNNKLDALNESLAGLYSLQRLSLAGNKLMHVEDSWFHDLSKLFELDLSRNKLTFVPADALRPLVSLAVLKLAENPLIERDLSLLLGTGRRFEIVDASRVGLSRVPATLTRSVRTLRLVGNQLTSIDSGELDSYPLLRLLDLSNNRLTIVEDDALGRLDGLEELILTSNMLLQIPRSLPSGLRIFDLRQNAVSRLTANDLQGLYLLRELNLSGNIIESIEGGSFRQLPALESLDISDNPIKTLPSDALSGPTNLAHLRMSGLMSLETDKNRNQDTAFPILAPERLVKLDVSRSPALAALLLADSAALSACKSLQELDLSYAKVSVLRSDLTYVLPQLRKLSLIGNQWNCSHDQFWLGEWIKQHADSIEYSARCAAPADLEGTILQDLPSNHTTPKKTIIEWEMKMTNAKILKLNGSTVDVLSNKSKDSMIKLKDSTTVSEVTHANNITKNLAIVTKSQMNVDTTPTWTFTTKHPKGGVQDSRREIITKKNETEVLSMTSHNSEQSINAANGENWSDLITTTNPEEYISKINLKPSKYSKQKFLKSWLVLKGETSKPTSMTTSVEFTSPNIDVISNKGTKNISTFTSTSKVFEKTTAMTTSTPFVTTITNKPFTSIVSNTNTNVNSYIRPEIIESTTKKLVSESKQPASMTLENINLRLMMKNQKLSSTTWSKKTMSQAASELLHSKLLLANDEPRVINNVDDERQPSSIAEGLNSQATESGARTAAGESLTSGAHPGMLVLLGAAIGAAAALTVVLSRRATTKRRGGDQRRYQRHEDIEVHALTPTQELW